MKQNKHNTISVSSSTTRQRHENKAIVSNLSHQSEFNSRHLRWRKTGQDSTSSPGFELLLGQVLQSQVDWILVGLTQIVDHDLPSQE
jgi:hypothetical protein